MVKNKLCTLAVVAGLLSGGGVSAAGLQNGDFSSSFDNWSGQVDYFDDYNSSQMNATTTHDFFTVEGANDSARLSTNTVFDTNIQDYVGWAVALFQDFTMPTLTAVGNILQLDFDFQVQLDDTGGGDNWYAQLTDNSGSGLSPLNIGSGSVDVTSFAGLDVQILFGIENIAGNDDWLQIDNVSITQKQASNIPEPGIFALLGLGALMLRRKIF